MSVVTDNKRGFCPADSGRPNSVFGGAGFAGTLSFAAMTTRRCPNGFLVIFRTQKTPYGVHKKFCAIVSDVSHQAPDTSSVRVWPVRVRVQRAYRISRG